MTVGKKILPTLTKGGVILLASSKAKIWGFCAEDDVDDGFLRGEETLRRCG
jgi:hypothetical protein